MHALIDNQTQLMRIMDRDRNRIKVLEARIKELQGQVIDGKGKKPTWTSTGEVVIEMDEKDDNNKTLEVGGLAAPI